MYLKVTFFVGTNVLWIGTKTQNLYAQTVLLACSLHNIYLEEYTCLSENNWSSHSQIKIAKYNTRKIIIIPKITKKCTCTCK